MKVYSLLINLIVSALAYQNKIKFITSVINNNLNTLTLLNNNNDKINNDRDMILSKSHIDIDYTKLAVDDPLFLDMPWPKESGPLSEAFSQHMQWKRKLSDVER